MENEIEAVEVENDETPEVEEIETNESNEEESTNEVDDSEEGEEVEEETRVVKKTNGFKKRIDKLKQKEILAKEEAEYWKQQALRKADPKPEEKKPIAKNNDAPNPDNFDSYEDYLEAFTDYKVDIKLNARREERSKEAEKSRASERSKQWIDKVSIFSERTPDFEEVMEEADDLLICNAAQEAIFHSDIGPELVYELAKNPKELERINNLPPTRAILELGKIEARLTKKETKKTLTKAPRPLKPTKGGGKISKDLSDPNLSQREYEALRVKKSV